MMEIICHPYRPVVEPDQHYLQTRDVQLFIQSFSTITDVSINCAAVSRAQSRGRRRDGTTQREGDVHWQAVEKKGALDVTAPLWRVCVSVLMFLREAGGW